MRLVKQTFLENLENNVKVQYADIGHRNMNNLNADCQHINTENLSEVSSENLVRM